MADRTIYKPYVGDDGTSIEVDMGEDLTSWTALKFYVRKPKADDNETEEKLVIATKKAGDGNEQIMQYVIGSGTGDAKVDFDDEGRYDFQPWGNNGAGWNGFGETFSFTVYGRYK